MTGMLSVLIPAYNEGERIGATVTSVRSSFPQAQIVVIDDGSSDDTAMHAEVAGADTVWRQRNQGKGAALRAGLDLAKGDILLLLDADLGETASEATKLVAPVIEGIADMTIATFPRPAPFVPSPLSDSLSDSLPATSSPPPQRGGGMGFVVRLARSGIRWMTGKTMDAPLSGQRCIRTETLIASGGFASGWGVEVALTIRALRAGYRVTEIPTHMSHRVTGRSWKDVLHRASQLLAVARILCYLAFFYALHKERAHHG